MLSFYQLDQRFLHKIILSPLNSSLKCQFCTGIISRFGNIKKIHFFIQTFSKKNFRWFWGESMNSIIKLWCWQTVNSRLPALDDGKKIFRPGRLFCRKFGVKQQFRHAAKFIHSIEQTVSSSQSTQMQPTMKGHHQRSCTDAGLLLCLKPPATVVLGGIDTTIFCHKWIIKSQ